MKKIIINGRFLSHTVTGVQRYAIEVTRALDKLLDKPEWELYVPRCTKLNYKYKNIKVVYSRSRLSNMVLWDHADYGIYVKKQGGVALNLCNSLNVLSPFVTCIHDINYKVNPQFYYDGPVDILKLVWNRLKYKFAISHSRKILTVSNFSKSEIMKYYHVPESKIVVVPNSWEHVKRIEASRDIFSRYKFLEPQKYYFSMSTLAANKNFKWILYAAKNNPGSVFAIAGGGNLKGAAKEQGFINLPNVHFLGYVPDEDAKALMENCKAFVFPTLYEGFGLTPLEAIASGARSIIVSDTPCMHEVYGDYARYVSPYDYECIMENIPPAKNPNLEKVLDMYSYVRSAEKVKMIMKKILDDV